jgi:predicted RecB family nuclease
VITDSTFAAFLKCPTKSYLEYSKCPGVLSETIDWQIQFQQTYRERCQARWASKLGVPEAQPRPPCIEELKSGTYPFLVDFVIQRDKLQSKIDALEWTGLEPNRKRGFYVPIRTFPEEKLTREHKYCLAFDALVLSVVTGKVPEFGKIVHGNNFRILTVKLLGPLNTVRSIVEAIATQQASDEAPTPVLNKHCVECKFRARCRKIAEEQDDLSLLSNLSSKERAKLNNKGIFTVRQLSYTFRVRRKPQHLALSPDKYSHALRALAIREQKIHVLGAPKLEVAGTRIFMDVEGIPDREFQYLVGLRIRNAGACVQHSFWADVSSDEKTIAAALIETLSQYENAQLVYYGSYEKSFLRKLAKRYPELFDGRSPLDSITARSTNLLQVIYAQIYFPTYSNGLKEIAGYLGFCWSRNNPTALDSIAWRSKWETSKEPELKERLITYNAEDCAALELVFNVIDRLQREPDCQDKPKTFVQVEAIRDQTLHKFRKNDFALPDMEYINGAAYWNYQRSKIYIRSSQRLKRLARLAVSNSSVRLPLNTIVEDRSPVPPKCPKCGSKNIYRYGWLSNKVCDLKFGKSGIKRWIAKYRYPRLICRSCRGTFSPSQRYSPDSKYGPGFMAYVLYNLVDLQISQAAVARTLNQFFGFGFTRHRINYVKSRAAQIYEDTYKQILARLAHGNLIHADETKIRLQGRDAFVWVFASLEDVAYVHCETREAATPKSLLANFGGVLVTDFYPAYDSVNCRQQKCLIHLIRDLNDDLRGNPFNEEILEVARAFTMLVRPMIETIDQYGLKGHHLRKHLKSVEHFYKHLAKRDYRSEIAVKYRRRLEKNRTSLFTFLEYEGVPWNNNNAEHAIKAFADLRNVIGGTSSPNGIREYLVLLSICQTCKYRGINFLEFARSGKTEIEGFANR